MRWLLAAVLLAVLLPVAHAQPSQPCTPPRPATDLSVSEIAATSATVRWFLPDEAVTWLILNAEHAPGSPVPTGSGQMSLRMEGLQAGIQYNLYIQAVNACAQAPPTGLVCFFTMPGPIDCKPAVVGGFGLEVTPESDTVRWTVTCNGLVKSRVEYAENRHNHWPSPPPGESWMETAWQEGEGNKAVEIGPLLTGKEFLYRIVGTCGSQSFVSPSHGVACYGKPMNATDYGCLEAGKTGIQIHPVGGTWANVAWLNHCGSSADPTSVSYRKRLPQEYLPEAETRGDWLTSPPATGLGEHTFNLTGLDSNTDYLAFAQNACGALYVTCFRTNDNHYPSCDKTWPPPPPLPSCRGSTVSCCDDTGCVIIDGPGASASGLSISNLTTTSAFVHWETGCGAMYRLTSGPQQWQSIPSDGNVARLAGLSPGTNYTVMVNGCMAFASGQPAFITFETEDEPRDASAPAFIIAVAMLCLAATTRKSIR